MARRSSVTPSRSARARCSPGPATTTRPSRGHGTLTASNILGQGVVNGLAPCFADLAGRPGAQPCSGGGTYPGAVVGGAPNAKARSVTETSTSSFESRRSSAISSPRGAASTSRRTRTARRRRQRRLRRREPGGRPHLQRSRRSRSVSTGNGAPGFGTTTPPQPLAGIVGRRLHAVRRHRLGLDQERSQVADNDVDGLVEPRAAADRRNGVDVVADGAFSPGDLTLNSSLDGPVAWETWGGTSRSTPVTRRRDRARLPGVAASHGGTIPTDFFTTAKRIVKSSAQDLGYECWIQGSGSVDAAAQSGSPPGPCVRRPGRTGVPAAIAGRSTRSSLGRSLPGQSDSQAFTVNGPGTWRSPTAT